MTIVRCL